MLCGRAYHLAARYSAGRAHFTGSRRLPIKREDCLCAGRNGHGSRVRRDRSRAIEDFGYLACRDFLLVPRSEFIVKPAAKVRTAAVLKFCGACGKITARKSYGRSRWVPPPGRVSWET